MSAVRRSFLLSFADSYLAIVLQVASAVVIARLLTPAEVGVFAIATVFSALAANFRDFGVGEYMIQAKELGPERIRAAMAMNLIVSWSMAVAMFGGANFVGEFYREPGVGDVMRVLAFNFLLLPFGALVQSWFRRELNYTPIIVANASANLVAFAVSVWLALSGFGAMSLAWSSLAGITTTVLVATAFRPAWFPRWPSLKGIGEVFHFGKFASGVYILAQAGRGAPEMVIGRVMGAAEVGIFSRGASLVEMLRRLLLRPVMMVCLPYFAKAEREHGAVMPAYLRSVTLVTAVGWPFLAFFAVAAFAIIRIIYGTQWYAAVPLAQILCLAGAIELAFLLSREALLAVGAARRANSLQLQIVVLQVAGVMLVIPFGMAGAAWGLVAAALLGLVATQRMLRGQIGLSSTALLRALAPNLLLTLISAGPLAALAAWQPVGESNYVVWAVGGGLATLLLWLLGLKLLGHPLWAEVQGVATKLQGRFARR